MLGLAGQSAADGTGKGKHGCGREGRCQHLNIKGNPKDKKQLIFNEESRSATCINFLCITFKGC